MPEREHLSRIVEVINERFGLELGDADQLLFDQFEQGWVDDPTLAAQRPKNDLDNFRLAFDQTFMTRSSGAWTRTTRSSSEFSMRRTSAISWPTSTCGKSTSACVRLKQSRKTPRSACAGLAFDRGPAMAPGGGLELQYGRPPVRRLVDEQTRVRLPSDRSATLRPSPSRQKPCP